MLVTELVTNAFKYAYPAGAEGEIRVQVKRSPAGGVALVIEDDGVGWQGFGEATGTGVGGRIITAMAANLRSTVAYDAAHRGTRVTIELME